MKVGFQLKSAWQNRQPATAPGSANGEPKSGTRSKPSLRAAAAPVLHSAPVATNPAWSRTTNGDSNRLCTNAKALPEAAVGFLGFGSGNCAGTVILNEGTRGNPIVLTAAHCFCPNVLASTSGVLFLNRNGQGVCEFVAELDR